MRKVLSPVVTRRICTISLTRSPSGVVNRLALVPSPRLALDPSLLPDDPCVGFLDVLEGVVLVY